MSFWNRKTKETFALVSGLSCLQRSSAATLTSRPPEFSIESNSSALTTPSPSPSPTPYGIREWNGITVGQPKVYDDALLQQMLQDAEVRLATLQVIDQTEIAKRLGAVTGASQQISSLGLNVQG